MEVNLEKIKVVCDLRPPKTIKDIQHLTERVAALNRFVSKTSEHCFPFFQTLKHLKDFWWIDEYQKAFDGLRSYLSSPPLLGRLDPGELFFYIWQLPPCNECGAGPRKIWFRSPSIILVVLRDAEIRYSRLEKLVYALLIVARKLRLYFQAHTTLLTDQSIEYPSSTRHVQMCR